MVLELATASVNLVSQVLAFADKQLDEAKKRKFHNFIKDIREEESKNEWERDDEKIINLTNSLTDFIVVWGNEIAGTEKI